MVILGRVEGGAIVLEVETMLPEGARVRVEVLGPLSDERAGSAEPSSLFQRLKSVAGAAKGLPPDLAAQHDHYLHGQPKR